MSSDVPLPDDDVVADNLSATPPVFQLPLELEREIFVHGRYSIQDDTHTEAADSYSGHERFASSGIKPTTSNALDLDHEATPTVDAPDVAMKALTWSHICGRYRHAAIGDPRLWLDIQIKPGHLDVAKSFVGWSNDQAIRIRILRILDFSDPDLDQLQSILISHSKRICTLALDINHPAPTSNPTWIDAPSCVFATPFPGLNRLELTSDEGCETWLFHLIDAASELFRQLKALIIRTHWRGGVLPPPDPTRQPVRLNNLETLEITTTATAFSTNLLHAFFCPSSATIRLTYIGHASSQGSPGTETVSFRFSGTHSPALTRVVLDVRTATLDSVSSHFRHEFQRSGQDFGEVVAEATAVYFENARDLNITLFSGVEFDEQIWTQLLRPMDWTAKFRSLSLNKVRRPSQGSWRWIAVPSTADDLQLVNVPVVNLGGAMAA